MKLAHPPSTSAGALTHLATPTRSQAQLHHAGRAPRAGPDPVGWFIVPQRTSGFYQEERRPPPRRDTGSGPPVQGRGEPALAAVDLGSPWSSCVVLRSEQVPLAATLPPGAPGGPRRLQKPRDWPAR